MDKKKYYLVKQNKIKASAKKTQQKQETQVKDNVESIKQIRELQDNETSIQNIEEAKKRFESAMNQFKSDPLSFSFNTNDVNDDDIESILF